MRKRLQLPGTIQFWVTVPITITYLSRRSKKTVQTVEKTLDGAILDTHPEDRKHICERCQKHAPLAPLKWKTLALFSRRGGTDQHHWLLGSQQQEVCSSTSDFTIVTYSHVSGEQALEHCIKAHIDDVVEKRRKAMQADPELQDIALAVTIGKPTYRKHPITH
jgi:hypothetical protein